MKDTELKGQFGRSGAFKKIAINKTIPLINAKNIPNLSKFLDVPEKQLEERAKLVRENIDFQERISNVLGRINLIGQLKKLLNKGSMMAFLQRLINYGGKGLS
jgi:exonuclease I